MIVVGLFFRELSEGRLRQGRSLTTHTRPPWRETTRKPLKQNGSLKEVEKRFSIDYLGVSNRPLWKRGKPDH